MFKRGQTVRARGHFMRGKYLKLQVASGEDDHCAICNSFAPLGQHMSEILSFDLEKLLFKNAIMDNRGDGFGILFDRNGGTNHWMIACKGKLSHTELHKVIFFLDCLAYEGDHQNVKDECFRLRFHIENHNIQDQSDLRDVFAHSPMLTQAVIQDIRNDFVSLNRAYTLEMIYYSRKLERKFYFNSDESKIFLGLTGQEFTFIYEKYLRPHEWRFRVFNGKEVFACLMLLIRSGQSQNFVHAFLQKYTSHSVTIQCLRRG